MNCLKIVILVLFVEFFRTLTMNSLNCEVFLIFLIPTIIAVRNQRRYVEKSPECGISCDKSPCQSPFAWCANDTVCGKVCISIGHVCNEPEEIENGGIKGTNRLYGAKITYYCEDDYELIGSKDRTCVGDKEWSGKPPYCVRKGIRCDKPPDVVENGYADTVDGKEEFYVGDNVKYKCHIGFFPIISINNLTSCNLNSDGSSSWTPKINLKCEEKKCDSPDNITNGIYSGNPPYKVGAKILYHCNNGYTLEGPSTRTCTDNQQWSETTPVCAAPVSYPSNMRIILASENSAKVTWTPSPNFDEKNDRYILYLNATNGPKHPVPFNLPRDVNEYEITGLHKNDEYVFWMVTTRNGKETQITKPVHYIHVLNGDNIPAEVVAFDDTVRANLKGSVSLKCSVVGKPTPSITWFKADKPIVENSRIYSWDKRILFINDLRKEDEGEYICRAKNEHGEGEVVYELVFQEPNTITTPSDVTPTVPEISSTTECDPFLTDCFQLLPGNTAYDNCQFKKNAHVRAVMDDQQIIDESIEVPDQSILKLRCHKINEFYFEGDNILQCDKTKWNGSIPICSRLSPRRRDKIPMINYEITNGTDNVDDDGTLNVTEGATLKLSCLYYQTYLKYNIKWISSDKTEIINAAWNSRQNAYELILSPISRIYESKYSCCIDEHLCNSVRIRVTEFQCEDPSRPNNGFIRGDVSKTLGSEIEYGCDINYVPVGEQISKCIFEYGHLKWSHPPPQCRERTCDRPLTPRNGHIRNIGDRKVNSIVNFSCDPGYKLSGQGNTTCLWIKDKLQWSNPTPECIKSTGKKCGKLSVSFEKEIKYDTEPELKWRFSWTHNYEHGTTATLICKEGYEIVPIHPTITTAATILCVDGQWIPNNLNCVEARCSCRELPKQMNKRKRKFKYCNDFVVSKTYQMTECQEGYTAKTNYAASCIKGEWILYTYEMEHNKCNEMKITTDCQLDLRGDSGLLAIHGDTPHQENVIDFNDGSLIKFICKTFYYTLEGAKNATCIKGQWTEEKPKCVSTSSEDYRLPPYLRFLSDYANDNHIVADDGRIIVPKHKPLIVECFTPFQQQFILVEHNMAQKLTPLLKAIRGTENVFNIQPVKEKASATVKCVNRYGSSTTFNLVFADTCGVDVHELERRGLRVVPDFKQRTYVEGDKIMLECSSNKFRTNQHSMICKSGGEWEYGKYLPC